MGKINEQLIEGLYAHIRQMSRCLASQPHALFQREQRLLLGGDGHSDDDLVDQLGRAAYNVEMTHGDGIEGTGSKRTFHDGSFSYGRNGVRRAT